MRIELTILITNLILDLIRYKKYSLFLSFISDSYILTRIKS